MLGAIIGDVIGSVYEWHNTKSADFELYSRFTRFTDDTVLTVAVADAILSFETKVNDGDDCSNKIGVNKWKGLFSDKRLYGQKIKQYANWYPDAGYGGKFKEWFRSSETRPYRSYGNGSAMRVSPIGFASLSLEEALIEAKRSAIVTHNHREGIKGAQAVAAAVFLAKKGKSKDEIRSYIQRKFKYNLEQTLDEIRPSYQFDSSCQGSVPQAIIAFLESIHFEDAIRKAISIGGDSDTIASIAGGISHAYYKEIPGEMVSEVMLRLDTRLRDIVRKFNETYAIPY